MTLNPAPLRSLPLFFLAMLLIAAMTAALAACGGDDDDDGGAGDSTDNGSSTEDGDSANDADAAAGNDDGDSEDAGSADNGDAGGPAASGSGSGTLVVDGQTLEFDVSHCLFESDTGNEDVHFTLGGSGTIGDSDFEVDASIVDLGGGIGEVHAVSVYNLGEMVELYASNPLMQDPGEFAIDGDRVTYEAQFWSDDGNESAGTGIFEATCP